MKLFQELKRRNVFKVGIVYAVTAWILLQVTEVVSDILELPVWAPKLVLLILAVGFVPALILAWAFELTPEGLKLERDITPGQSIAKKTGRKLDFIIIVLLGLSLGYFIWESRFEQKTVEYEQAVSQAARAATELEPVEPAVPGPVAPAADNSIAVLPFANRSADEKDIYFTDGIHDDLLTHLSRIGAFRVISRTSVMEYRDTAKNIKDIARELNVANVMEGAVQRAGDRVRINVQLIDAETDEHLWAEIYDRELTTENLFDIQSEIAQNIADALRATLTDAEKSVGAKPPTEDLEAYDLYLQARAFAIGETRISYQTALDLYEEALRLDPDFALAWLGLAKAHITTYWYTGDPGERDNARTAIDRAREIDPDLPDLNLAEGFYWYWGHLDYERALYHLQRAIRQMPGNNDAHMFHGWASRRAGLWDQAVDSMKHALRLDPRVAFNWVEYGGTLTYLHRFDEAREAYASAMELDPSSFWTKTDLAELEILEKGDVDAAVRLTTGAQHTGDFGFLSGFFRARLADRRFEEALEAAQAMPATLEINRQVILLKEDMAARILFFMGREEEARASADAAWFRLRGLRDRLGDDYRISMAEAFLAAIRGQSADEVEARIEQVLLTRPEDAVEEMRFSYQFARVYAMAGMAKKAVEQLEPGFEPPSETSVHRIDLDPAFDGIRDNPEFIAMMERHR